MIKHYTQETAETYMAELAVRLYAPNYKYGDSILEFKNDFNEYNVIYAKDNTIRLKDSIGEFIIWDGFEVVEDNMTEKRREYL